MVLSKESLPPKQSFLQEKASLKKIPKTYATAKEFLNWFKYLDHPKDLSDVDFLVTILKKDFPDKFQLENQIKKITQALLAIYKRNQGNIQKKKNIEKLHQLALDMTSAVVRIMYPISDVPLSGRGSDIRLNIPGRNVRKIPAKPGAL